MCKYVEIIIWCFKKIHANFIELHLEQMQSVLDNECDMESNQCTTKCIDVYEKACMLYVEWLVFLATVILTEFEMYIYGDGKYYCTVMCLNCCMTFKLHTWVVAR